MSNKHPRVEAVDVYLEKRKSREYVGQLSSESGYFVFTYDKKYLYNSRSIPLGPDLPLTQKEFRAKILFATFEDRIPSKKNPAYHEYCEMVDIDPQEKDLLTLVATLGHKGPSSFIFSPAPRQTLSSENIKNFRKLLTLSLREFCELFDFSPATILGIENEKISGKDALKRLEIYCRFPEVALQEVLKNRHKIHETKMVQVEKILRSAVKIKAGE